MDGVDPPDPDGGETVDEVGRRADRLLERIHAETRLVVLFAHAHVLRILTARWCGLDPRAGRLFILDPASVSILGHERETRCIERWNLVTTGDLERFIGTADGRAATIDPMSAHSSTAS